MSLPPFSDLIHIKATPASHTEKLISGIGAFLAIYAIYNISQMILGEHAFFIVASMGAAAVLLFAVPHSPLSQPWPLFGGNLLAAFIGVACAHLIPETIVAAAAAVGISITAMYYLKCLHPPAGATALAAVVSGPAVTALGFQYIITPILINLLVIFFIAVIFNYSFKWRRYPASLTKAELITPISEAPQTMLSHQGIESALQQMDSFIDINEEDLKQIYRLASEFDQKNRPPEIDKDAAK